MPGLNPSVLLPEGVRPTNFLSISRTSNSIEDTWVIDPTLQISAALLPPLEGNETRKNAKIESTHGSIDAHVWIAPGTTTPEGAREQSTLYFKSQHGSVRAKVVSTASTTLRPAFAQPGSSTRSTGPTTDTPSASPPSRTTASSSSASRAPSAGR